MTHLPRLTAYRFVAAFAVLLHHLDVHGGLPLAAFTSGGEAGVAFFFALSGFILAWTYQGGVGSFWLRRVARIYPTALAGTALALVALALGAKGMTGSWAGLVPSLTLTQTWFPPDHIRYGFNGPLWSLSAEMFFYATFPLFAVWLSKLSQRSLLRLTVILSLAIPPVMVGLVVAMPGSTLDTVWAWYTHPVARLPEFVAGVCAGLLVRSGWRFPLPLGWVVAAYAAGCVVGSVVMPFGVWGAVTLPGTIMLLVAAATADLSGRSRLLDSPVAQYLGRVSFCLYVVHDPVILLFATWFDRPWVVGLLAVPVAFALAAAFHRFVEIPGQRFVVRMGGPRSTVEATGDVPSPRSV